MTQTKIFKPIKIIMEQTFYLLKSKGLFKKYKTYQEWEKASDKKMKEKKL